MANYVASRRRFLMANILKNLTEKFSELLEDFNDNFQANFEFEGAYSIREDGACAEHMSSKNVKIELKKDKPGLDIYVKEGTKNEIVYIPACVTKGGIDDLVYNDFHIEPNCDVVIIAGCSVHTDTHETAKHNGIHSFFIGENSKVLYEEKHIATGEGDGEKNINPVTHVELEKNAYCEMDTLQLHGVTNSDRKTTAICKEGAKLIVHERILTENEEKAESVFEVKLIGDNSHADIVSRSVAKDKSYQNFISTVIGDANCSGHSECDAIIDGEAIVDASPRLFARNKDASLIHEAAIGKIAGEQILKFKSLGLTQEEAEAKIIEGFLA